MKARLLSRMPGIKWSPSDIASDEPISKPKEKPRYVFTLRSAPPHASTDAVSRPREPQRTISITSEPDSVVDARTHAQSQSMFFARLPLELRKQVYEYVMGEATIHLTLGAKKKFRHFVCEDRAPRERECACRVLVGGRESERLNAACVRLLRVCRRMYSESIAHLYRPHAFSLLHVTHLLYLPTRVPSQRLCQIRTLRLRWAIRALPYLRRGPSNRIAYREDTENWERGWAILAGMTGLRDLYVVLVDPSPQQMWERNWLELEGRLLQPVKEVTKPNRFELVLPYASCRTDWVVSDMRIQLRRPQEGLMGEEG
ncbi:hypothetical protein ACN47E_002570 [Coniothyrium glycines]